MADCIRTVRIAFCHNNLPLVIPLCPSEVTDSFSCADEPGSVPKIEDGVAGIGMSADIRDGDIGLRVIVAGELGGEISFEEAALAVTGFASTSLFVRESVLDRCLIAVLTFSLIFGLIVFNMDTQQVEK
jgi:hypothetical protein